MVTIAILLKVETGRLHMMLQRIVAIQHMKELLKMVRLYISRSTMRSKLISKI